MIGSTEVDAQIESESRNFSSKTTCDSSGATLQNGEIRAPHIANGITQSTAHEWHDSGYLFDGAILDKSINWQISSIARYFVVKNRICKYFWGEERIKIFSETKINVLEFLVVLHMSDWLIESLKTTHELNHVEKPFFKNNMWFEWRHLQNDEIRASLIANWRNWSTKLKRHESG